MRALFALLACFLILETQIKRTSAIYCYVCGNGNNCGDSYQRPSAHLTLCPAGSLYCTVIFKSFFLYLCKLIFSIYILKKATIMGQTTRACATSCNPSNILGGYYGCCGTNYCNSSKKIVSSNFFIFFAAFLTFILAKLKFC